MDRLQPYLADKIFQIPSPKQDRPDGHIILNKHGY